jgi:hypothetical protein
MDPFWRSDFLTIASANSDDFSVYVIKGEVPLICLLDSGFGEIHLEKNLSDRMSDLCNGTAMEAYSVGFLARIRKRKGTKKVPPFLFIC